MRTAWITLGRYGDVINTLPLVLDDHRSGNTATMIVSQPYIDLLDGISYCDSRIWPKHYSTPQEAAKWALGTGQFNRIYVCQCYGTKHDIVCSNFCEESWRLVGKHELWGTVPLVFDRRNQEREDDLLVRVGNRGKPMVLVSTNGLSSPFANRAELMSVLEPLRDRYDFIDLAGFKAERFYDLLALYERAFCLITIDTGTLHLAQATPNLPVIAIVTDSPTKWHGSPSRPNHILRITYREFSFRKNEIRRLLENPIAMSQPRLFHVWNDYQGRSADADRRHRIAKASWEMEYSNLPWHPVVVTDDMLKRTGADVGAHKPVPFVNDLIDAAADRACDGDVIVLTNDDTIFVDGIGKRILESCPCWGPRFEKTGVILPVTLEQASKSSYLHCGADVFAFTKHWWCENRDKFPPMLVSFEAWDLVLRTLINLKGGQKIEGLCCHILHNPEWHSPKHRESKANLFNRGMAVKFFSENKMPWPKV